MKLLLAIVLASLPAFGQGFGVGNARRLQSKTVCTDAPADANVLTFSVSRGCWAPAATKISCQPGIDSANAITAGTYSQTVCFNDTGVTVTITGIKCFSDNSGTSTLNVTNKAGTSLLTGLITCSPTFASGTQSATTTLADGDWLVFSFVADGASKHSTWVVTETK